MNQTKLKKLIKNNLTNDLRKKEYQNHSNKYYGHCYVASEVFYHLTGKIYKPMVMRLSSGGTHWFLKKDNNIVDLTVEQFDKTPNYSLAKSIGFLTKSPSKRAKILIDRINSILNEK